MLLGALTGCSLVRRPSPPATTAARYVIGDAYHAGGIWYYPREETQYSATGLATVAEPHQPKTADGETFDGSALAAAHQTLQLPAIARVTNLENGRQILVRLNDRGPASPSRLVALTPHAAALLQAADGTQVRVELDEDMTHVLAEQLGGGPRVAVTAVPLAEVQSEALPPPTGSAQSVHVRTGPTPVVTQAARSSVATTVPARLPDVVVQTPPQPGRIIIRASEFTRADYAQRFAARIGGLVEHINLGRSDIYRVRAGPYATVRQADAALDQVLQAGVIDARIVIE